VPGRDPDVRLPQQFAGVEAELRAETQKQNGEGAGAGQHLREPAARHRTAAQL
jgi:hypothetical protein